MSYIPTESDVEWTRNAINGRVVWAIPSIGCVLLIMHDRKGYQTYMKSNPTELETEEYEKVESNCSILGYREISASIIGEANNADDILMILKTVIEKRKQELEPDEFWERVDAAINVLLEFIKQK